MDTNGYKPDTPPIRRKDHSFNEGPRSPKAQIGCWNKDNETTLSEPILVPPPLPALWWMKLHTCNEADLFGWPSSDGLASTRLLYTESIVELAAHQRWTNMRFDPVWAS
jgi:hypothetical protein